jgi:hypothetical protein
VAVIALAGISVLAHRVAADAPAGRYDNRSGPGTVYDKATKLAWEGSVVVTTYDWSGADAYCRGSSLPGTGWRLPSMKELQTILDESEMGPAVDQNYFPSTPSGLFWTSSMDATSAAKAWVVDFNVGGTASSDLTTTMAYVRCVR